MAAASFPLLNLPYELQQHVLAHVFADAESLVTDWLGTLRPTGTHHHILLASRYCHDTFLQLYYAHLTLRITSVLPTDSKWARAAIAQPRLYSGVRRLSLARWTDFQDASWPGHAPARSLFSYFPNLTDVVIDGASPGEEAEVWDVPCSLYVAPDDVAGTVKLLREFGGCEFKRPRGVPSGVKCWERHYLLLSWRCSQEDGDAGRDGERAGCPNKRCEGANMKRVDYRSVVVSCDRG